MPKLEKAIRREQKRQRAVEMAVDGRGLITSAPNFEKRKEKERSQRKRRNRGKRE